MKTTKTDRPVSAIAATEAGVMQEFARHHRVLSETHSAIPALLARERTITHELGLAEAQGESGDAPRKQLADVIQQRQAAVRQRAAAVAAVVELEPALQSERASLERQRQQYAVHAVAQFRERYAAAVADLQALWETGRALGIALRTEVPMPLPVRVMTSPVDGVSRAQPMRSVDAAPVVAEEAARLGASLDQVDEALSLCAAVRQSREFDSRHHRLGLLRGASSEFSGVYRVLLPFRCQIDGCEFQPGELVDSTLLGPGMMSRLQVGRRHIEPAALQTGAVAAA